MSMMVDFLGAQRTVTPGDVDAPKVKDVGEWMHFFRRLFVPHYERASHLLLQSREDPELDLTADQLSDPVALKRALEEYDGRRGRERVPPCGVAGWIGQP